MRSPPRKQRLPGARPSRHSASRPSQLNVVINNRNWGSSSPYMFCSFLTRPHPPPLLFRGRARGPAEPQQGRGEPGSAALVTR